MPATLLLGEDTLEVVGSLPTRTICGSWWVGGLNSKFTKIA